MNRSLEDSFQNLVSIKANYKTRTEKELKEVFKAMFAKEDNNNIEFFDNLSYNDLIDLCICFNLYLLTFSSVCFKDLGIVKFEGLNRKFFLFTETTANKNNYNEEIIGVSDHAELLLMMMDDSLVGRKARCFHNFSICSKAGRASENNFEHNLAEEMIRCMNDETDVELIEGTIKICKSSLRVLSDKYSKICTYLDLANDRFINNNDEKTKEMLNFIHQLKEHKIELQLKLRKMICEIDATYNNSKYEDFDSMDETAKRLLDIDDKPSTPTVAPRGLTIEGIAKAKRGTISITHTEK